MTNHKTREEIKSNVQDFLANATSLLSGLKKMADEKMDDLQKDIKKRGMWDQDRGKKLVADMMKETDKFMERVTKDAKSMANKLSENSPVMMKDDLLKTFASKEDLKSMEERLLRALKDKKS